MIRLKGSYGKYAIVCEYREGKGGTFTVTRREDGKKVLIGGIPKKEREHLIGYVMKKIKEMESRG